MPHKGPSASEAGRLEAGEEAVELQRQRLEQCGHRSRNAATPRKWKRRRVSSPEPLQGARPLPAPLFLPSETAFSLLVPTVVRDSVHVVLSHPGVW